MLIRGQVPPSDGHPIPAVLGLHGHDKPTGHHCHLQDNAALDEVIKGDLPSSLSVKLADEDVVELVREPVALEKKDQSQEGWQAADAPVPPPKTPQPNRKRQLGGSKSQICSNTF